MSAPSAPGAYPQTSDEAHSPEALSGNTPIDPTPSRGGIRLPGVEEPLPPGEEILWQGRPGLWPTALRVLHLRALLVYWTIVAAGFLAWGAAGGPTAGSLAADLTWLAVVALLGNGVVLAFAWLIRVTSLYVVTPRRIVMRVGIALPGVLNLPFEEIGSVDLRGYPDGSGDLVLTPAGKERVGWLFLWPHVKPWQWKDPLPALRALNRAGEVGDLVATQLQDRLGHAPASPSAASAPQERVSPEGVVS